MTDQCTTTVGVVIPVLNEAATLVTNLEALLADSEIDEIVVVDGGSTDGTQALVEAQCKRAALRHDDRLRWRSSSAGRGLQMNVGARHINTDWIIFHHADSRLPACAGSIIAQQTNEVQWGGFRHTFSPNNWKLRFVSALHNWRCRVSGVIYGDQSMFVRKSLFDGVGGFVEDALEDLVFSDAALELTPSILLDEAVQTDSRKFTQVGEFRALAQVLSIVWRYQRRHSIGNTNFFLPYR